MCRSCSCSSSSSSNRSSTSNSSRNSGSSSGGSSPKLLRLYKHFSVYSSSCLSLKLVHEVCVELIVNIHKLERIASFLLFSFKRTCGLETIHFRHRNLNVSYTMFRMV